MRLWLALWLVLLPLVSRAQAVRVEAAQWRGGDGGVNSGSWQAVSLPHRWTAPANDAAMHELQIELPTSSEALALYLPRVQAAGPLAVHVDGRLVYRSPGDVAGSGANHPLYLVLHDGGSLPRPRLLSLQISGRNGGDVAVSALWLGTPAELEPMFMRRVWLQTGLLHYLVIGALAMALFAFGLWLADRRERLYLLFAVFAVMWALRSLRYLVGPEPVPLWISPAWFIWISNNAGNALVLAWTTFAAALLALPPRWLLRSIGALTLATALLTLPALAAVPLVELLSAKAYLLTIAIGMPTGLYMAWLAWRGPRGVKLEARLVTAVGLLHIPVAVHDWLLQSQQIDPESYFWWPLSTTCRLAVFVVIILRRHVQAVQAVDQVNRELAYRLAAREAELSASHEALRDAQQRQAVAAERQRLMQDLHDGMGSQLISAMRVAEAGALSSADMNAVLRDCLDDLRLTVDSLEPVDADLLLLLATLRYRMAPRLQAAGLVIHWDIGHAGQVGLVPSLPWLDPRGALHVLRIVQEALSNILQHAQARSLRVAVVAEQDAGRPGVAVLLDDDGSGFAAEQRSALGAGKGLRNMERRAQALGALVLAATGAWNALSAVAAVDLVRRRAGSTRWVRGLVCRAHRRARLACQEAAAPSITK